MIETRTLAAYAAARQTTAFADLAAAHSPGPGWLRITGRDRLDLLHRLSTNDLRKLAAGHGLPTVLTSPTARVIGLLMVYADADTVSVRTMPGQAPAISGYLNSMIFWQDEVSVEDLTAATASFGLYGPATAEVLGRMSGEDLAGEPAYAWRRAKIAGAPVTLYRGGPLEVQAWTIVVSPPEAATVAAALTADLPQLDAGAIDILRVEAGLPAWGHELNDQVTPLETGLLPAISFNKGCYTGQEIIARQTNYDKVTRNLAGLLLPPGAASEHPGIDFTGAAVRGSGSGAGRGPNAGPHVGTIVFSPTMNRPIALAILPRETAQPGNTVTIVRDAHEVTATVVRLPFAGTGGVK